MASYRPLGQFNQYFLDEGTVNNGGSITFYETDLTTLKDTYSDDTLITLNSNPVLLDSAGRLSTDVWGSGDYGAVIKDRSGVIIETRNNIQSGASAGQVIPALVTGDFLSNDGSNLSWQPIIQVPDPTGYANDILYNDGTTPYWAAPPPTVTLPTGGIAQTSDSFTVGKFIVQCGSFTVAATGSNVESTSVLFTHPMSSCLHVSVTSTIAGVTPDNLLALNAVVSKDGNGFSIIFSTNVTTGITNTISCTYAAYGILA